ncbi:MAG: 3-oxoadipate enol-lactonase [Devosia sp.]
MKFASIAGVTIAYCVTGPTAASVIAFANSLGTDLRIWDDVVPVLSPNYRVLTYDMRGHGLSDVPTGPYAIDDHVGDLMGLADHLGIDDVALAGVSVGGVVVQAAASRHAARVRALVLCDTAARIGIDALWNDRIATVTEHGTAAIADSIMERWFSPAFRRDRPAECAGWRNLLVAASRDGYAATCATLRDTDLTAEVASISAPTLVVVGEHDLSTPPDLVRSTAALIAGARFEIIRGAGHIPSIEQPEKLAALIADFLKDVGYV